LEMTISVKTKSSTIKNSDNYISMQIDSRETCRMLTMYVSESAATPTTFVEVAAKQKGFFIGD